MPAKYERAVIKGTAYWPHLANPDHYSEKYQMDIGNMDDETVTLLESKGVRMKTKENHPSNGQFVVARTKKPFKVMDRERNPIDVQETRIGNGSEVKVKVAFNDNHPLVDQHGTSLYLETIQVLDLVEYFSDPLDEEFD